VPAPAIGGKYYVNDFREGREIFFLVGTGHYFFQNAEGYFCEENSKDSLFFEERWCILKKTLKKP
jgi:hypothetical protein